MRRSTRTVLFVGLLLLLAGSSSRASPRKRLSLAELQALCTKVGFPDPDFAATIAMRESGGDPSTINDTRGRKDLPPGVTNEWSFGLFQINKLAWPQYAGRDLLDPETNARTALEIRQKHGWAPWSTAKAPAAPPAPPPAPPPAAPPAAPPEVTPIGPADDGGGGTEGGHP